MMERFDTNSDGRISKDEAPEALWERLSQLDGNGDGTIEASEWPKFGAKGRGDRRKALFSHADRDGDGKISSEEAGERWERLSKLDKNGDGAIEMSELPERPAGAPGQAGQRRGQFFAKADANGDGMIGQDEVPAQAWERLSRADTNGDGKVSPEELRQLRPSGDRPDWGAPKEPSANKPGDGTVIPIRPGAET